jgi:hypothetical protein
VGHAAAQQAASTEAVPWPARLSFDVRRKRMKLSRIEIDEAVVENVPKLFIDAFCERTIKKDGAEMTGILLFTRMARLIM